MSTIKQIFAREIFDSKGYPTIETSILTSNGIMSSSSVPTGQSKGATEAVSLLDNDQERFNGMGVLKAVETVNQQISPKLFGIDILNLQKIDSIMIELDGTPNKRKLGANSILSVSQAAAKAGAISANLTLHRYINELSKSGRENASMPTAGFNFIEGGKHALNSSDFQEFLIFPSSSKSFLEQMMLATTLYHNFIKILEQQNSEYNMGDEAGFAIPFPTNRDALVFLKYCIEKTQHKFSYDVFLGIDVAASSFKSKEGYKIKDDESFLSSSSLLQIYQKLISEFNLIYLEDPFLDDKKSWNELLNLTSQTTMIVGDDLTTTSPVLLQDAIDQKLINAVIIKPTQIGTVTESIFVSEIARLKDLKIVVSHRSRETMDDFIADFAVGVGADYVKFGAPGRERVAKYNRLLQIEKELEYVFEKPTSDDLLLKPL